MFKAIATLCRSGTPSSRNIEIFLLTRDFFFFIAPLLCYNNRVMETLSWLFLSILPTVFAWFIFGLCVTLVVRSFQHRDEDEDY